MTRGPLRSAGAQGEAEPPVRQSPPPSRMPSSITLLAAVRTEWLYGVGTSRTPSPTGRERGRPAIAPYCASGVIPSKAPSRKASCSVQDAWQPVSSARPVR